MRNLFLKFWASMGAFAFLALGFTGQAVAAITAADLAPIGDDIEATMTALTPWVIGLLAVVLGASIGIKLLKKFANRAS
jgi:hypothetical protein